MSKFKEGKIGNFLKKSGKYIIAITLAVAIASAIGVTAAVSSNNQNNNTNISNEEVPVSSQKIVFGLPMNNCKILNDYFDNELVYNSSMNEWSVHLGMDISSEDLSVFSVADGTVKSVDYDSLSGYSVEVEHKDGFVSVYSSLAENVKVKVGDSVKIGTKLGEASTTSGIEGGQDSHVHFSLYLNDKEVDPNNYLEFSNK
ncbi:MAG: M23 family metallopeptidase [Clostridia bacterium]|nr:M23 family metallopeptidase [Clostridia bacterium]